MSIQLLAIGSLYAIERGGSIDAGGCVADAVRAARATGAEALAAARIGMDRFGQDVLTALRAANANVTTIQTDPDLATPRCVRRGDTARMEPYGAFDTLQWDSDLEGATRLSEAIVTDACGWRHGQARSTIDRALIAAPTAVRCIDLIARPPGQAARLEREQIGNALELCDLFLLDAIAIRTITPAATDERDAIRRMHGLAPRARVIVMTRGTLLVAPSAANAAVEAVPCAKGLEHSTACAVRAAMAIVEGGAMSDVLSAWSSEGASKP